MEAYLPSGWPVLLTATLALLGCLAVGFAVTRISSNAVARISAWALVLIGMCGLERFCSDEAPGFRMLALIGMGLFGMKAVVAVESRISGRAPLDPKHWLFFSAGWFGMRPALFSSSACGNRQGGASLIKKGLARIVYGLLLVLLARWAWAAFDSRWVATLLMLPGLSLILHFGLFNIVAGLWRVVGFDCRSLFKAPLYSQSLSEFWSRRWNLAFSEMTALAVHRPCKRRLGPATATVLAFLFSGLLHEAAISLPVKAGFGFPMLYFLLHGAAMLVEKFLRDRGHPLEGWRGRLWTIAWLVVPLPFLFHQPFLRGVVWPLFQ